VCHKCAGSGIYYSQFEGKVFEDECFGCWSAGVRGKGYSREEAVARDERALKRQKREEEQRMAEWEAGAEERAKAELAEAEAQAKLEADRAEFVWFDAEVGAKVEIAGEVAFKKYVENQWGGSWLVMVKVAENCEVKMFSSANWVYDVEVGDAVVLNAEVKCHDEYEGKKQSQVIRPKRVA
jgi:hypothetical protein